jgi:Flp pilus assembly protein TadD
MLARGDAAWALARLGRHEEALAQNELLVSACPYDVEARLGLGESLAALGRHDRAIEAFLLAAELQPDNPLIYQYRRPV